MKHKKPIIVETRPVRKVPNLSPGGFVELKDGKRCLRKPDTIEATPDGRYLITKTWVVGNWKKDFYQENA